MANKLLLLKDVEALGRSGDIVSVKPGYARNFLLPQGVAVIADKNAIRMQARLQEERQKKAAEDRKESEKMAGSIEGLTLTTIVKVDHEGHMYGSVSAVDIVELLKEQASIELERRSIQLKHPIKETGAYTIHLKLKEGVTTSLKLKVMSEGAQEEVPAEQESAPEA